MWALLALAPTSVLASVRSEIVAIVQKFNAADSRTSYVAYCANDVVIVDHEPPFVFRGPDACGKDWDALVVWGEKHRIGWDHFRQDAASPVFFEKDRDQVYAVFPVKACGFTQNGRPKVEKLYSTFVFRRYGNTWRIAAITWSSLGFAPPVSSC
jgi:hypothetical protein